MRRILILSGFLLFIGIQAVFAQKKEITGTVTGAEDNEPLVGVSVVVKGTPIGAITDFDGKYKLSVPENAKTLVFSFVGMKTVELAIEGNEVNAKLESDIFGIDEVVVTGVASGTPKKKLSVTVERVGEEQLKEVPAVSAANALQGKLAGVSVLNTNGNPGGTPAIRLRGSTSMTGSNAPLILVDGVMIEGTLADINVDDIESMEVVKGASASALYGSRAGNGVIAITTKRGNNLAEGKSVITIRNEYGISQLANEVDIAQHHPYKLADDFAEGDPYTKYYGVTYPDSVTVNGVLVPYEGGYSNLIEGNQLPEDDGFADNPFASTTNHQQEIFKPGSFYTNYVSVGNNSGKTNFFASFENNYQEGIVFSTKGYNRQNIRVNVDHKLSDKFKISTSNLISQSYTDLAGASNNATTEEGGGQGTAFFDVLFMSPDVNLDLPNVADGTDYYVLPDQWSNDNDNPKYQLENVDRERKRNGVLSSFRADYYLADWVTLDAMYSYEKRNMNFTTVVPKGYLGGSESNIGGQLFKHSFKGVSQTFQSTANFNKKFGDITTKAKLSYQYEDYEWSSFEVTGNDLVTEGITTLDGVTGTKNISSEEAATRAKNIYGIVDADYKEKYIGSFLYRMDGSSLFGENERWAPYFRASGAYRISEDIELPHIDELKIRAAYGTAGQRPHEFAAQYETYYVSGGQIEKLTLGNKNLKPSLSKELEIALNVDFLGRFSLEAGYSKTNTVDQIIEVPLPAYVGFTTQWQNAGELEATVMEATLGALVMKTDNFSWNASATFDKIKQQVISLDAPPFAIGPGSNNTNVFWIRDGETFGIIYGYKWLTTLDEMAAQLPEGATIDDYVINSDGYVIEEGTEGTVLEAPIQLDEDNDGTADQVQIADINPDFHASFTSTFTFKNISLYALVDWKQGGDVYNLTKQWMYRDQVHGDFDQFDKEENQKKASQYYQVFYDAANVNDYFVEDGTYVKIRELALYYTLPGSSLENLFNGFIKSVKIGVVGRNLYTFTNYSGYDPEVAQGDPGDDLSNFAFDGYGYPNFRTYTGSLILKF